LAIGQATMNIAEGVTKALAMGPIIGLILAAVVASMGAVQIGIISAQKFATGGLFRGKGGPRDDQNLIYVSDGEFIINANATKKYGAVLEQINAAGFADGGSAGQSTRISSDTLAVQDAQIYLANKILIDIKEILISEMPALYRAVLNVDLSIKQAENKLSSLLKEIVRGVNRSELEKMWRGAKKWIGFASGGLVRGRGSGDDDQNMIRISNGEYVVNAGATRKYLPLLDAINAGKSVMVNQSIYTGANRADIKEAVALLRAINMNIGESDRTVVVRIEGEPNLKAQVEKLKQTEYRQEQMGKEYRFAR